MKRLITAVLALGFAATAMAKENSPRYKVYDVKLNGSGLEVKQEKGWWAENGDKERIDRFVKSGGSLRGYIVTDTWMEGWASSLFIEKGGYDQDEAELYFDFREINSGAVRHGENVLFRLYEKGIAVVNFNLELDEMEFEATVIGSWSQYQREKVQKGETNMVWNYSFNAVGAGRGWGPIDGYDVGPKPTGVKESLSESESTGIVVKYAKLKYNSKISSNMWEAYEGANGTNAVQAAADVLNELINKRAKIDDADFYFPELDD